MPTGQPSPRPRKPEFSLSAFLKAKARSEARRYARDESGVTAVIFGLMFTMVLFFVAMTVDTSRIVNELTREQNAVDAAALAASNLLGTERTPDQEQALAETFLDRNMDRGVDGGSHSNIDTLILDDANGEVTATAQSNLPATLMAAFKDSDGNRYVNFDIEARSKVKKGNGKVEIALVLDNSNSMDPSSGEDRIGQLKIAAENLVNTVYVGAEGTDKVKVSVVPYSISVNVGSQNAAADWMDTAAESSVHKENFCSSPSDQCPQPNRFTLFSQLGVAWKGCVEARPGTLDTTDAPATSGNAKFVPMFAPDEPDTTNASGRSYYNSYRADDMGTCPAQACDCVNKRSNGTCRSTTTWRRVPISSPTAQARTCKYMSNAMPSDNCSGSSGDRPGQNGTGPNKMCTTTPITPLSDDKQTVLDALTAMDTSSSDAWTNVGEGAMWGWRALSPGAPYNEGRSYDDVENKKFLIVMTDGANTYPYGSPTSTCTPSNFNHNCSAYGAHGYGAPFAPTSPLRLGELKTNSSYRQISNTKLETACINIKAEGITIFTVAFGTGLATSDVTRLRNCASQEAYAFNATDNSLLLQAFNNIGKEIAALRVSE